MADKSSTLKNWIQDNKLPVLLLTAAACLFALSLSMNNPGKRIYGSDTLLMGDDGTNLMQESFKNWELPFWNPYILGGMPHLASMAANVTFYPTFLLYHLFGTPVCEILLIEFTIAIIIGGIFMYLLTRELGVSKFPAFLAGIFFMFSGNLVATLNAGHSYNIDVMALIPAVFFFFEKGFKTKRLLYFVLTGCMLGGQSLLGVYQIMTYTIVSLGFYLIYKLVVEKVNPVRELHHLTVLADGGFKPPSACQKGLPPTSSMAFSNGVNLKYILYFFVMLITVPLFSAVQFFQSYYFIKHTFRASVDYDFFTSWSYHPTEVITYLLPKFYGVMESTYWGHSPFWLTSEYLGILPVVLAFVAAFFMFKDKRVMFYLIFLGLAFILSFGKYTPLYKLLFKVPLISGFRCPGRWLPFVTLSVITLSAIGCEFLFGFVNKNLKLENFKNFKNFKYTLIASAVAFLLLWLVFNLNAEGIMSSMKNFEGIKTRFVNQELPSVVSVLYRMILSDTFRLLMFFGSTMILILLAFYSKIDKYTLMFLFLVIFFIDVFTLYLLPYNTRDTIIKFIPIERADIKREEIVNFVKKDNSNYRVLALGDIGRANWFVSEKIQSIGGYHSAPLKNYNDAISKWLYKNPNTVSFSFLCLANVKYIVSEFAINHPAFKLVFDGNIKIYQYMNFYPKAFLYNKAEIIKDKDEIFRKVSDAQFNPMDAVILEEDFKEKLDNFRYRGDEVKINEFKPNSINMDVNAPGNSILYLSEVYYPEWKAYVDGKEAKIYSAFGTFRAVYVPKGIHSVKFVYDKKLFYVSLATSLFTTLAIVLIFGVFKLDKR